MKDIRKIILPLCGVLPLAALLLLPGCVKRDLELRPDEGSVEIALMWDGSSAHPQEARYLFYDQSGKLVREVTGVSDGFKGTLPAGSYRLIVHNTDAKNVDYRNIDSYETAEVFAMENGTAQQAQRFGEGRSADAGSCIAEPQAVFAVGCCKEFAELVVTASDTLRATVCPVQLTRQVNLHFTVNGASGLKSFTGVLNGVTPSVFLATGSYNASFSRAVEFAAKPESQSDYIAELSVFQLQTTKESFAGTNTVEVTLTDDKDTDHSATFDLTETLQEIIESNEGVIPVEVSVEVVLEVKLLEGLTATVRPWDEGGTGGGTPRPQQTKK